MAVSNIRSHFHKGISLIAGYFKTQTKPVPVSNRGSPVIEANESNFDKLVMDNGGREVFILFYAKTCPHCKTTVPIWEEFGEKLQNEDIDIVKLDTSENEYPTDEFKVDRLPTIYWKFAAAYRKPMKYRGRVACDDLIKFVAEMTTKELKGFDRTGKAKE